MDANTYYLNQKLNDEDDFISWVESNEAAILENYKETLEFDDVPDDYINSCYESWEE